MSWLPDWITGYDAENAARAAAADAELRRINEERIARGEYSQAQIDAIRRDYEQQVSFDPATQQTQITDAFSQGLNEGRSNVNSFLSGALGQFLKSIPTLVWLGLAVWLFVWLGGFAWLTRKGKGYFAA
jgi:hypothetical protein